jgi:hypothetical protein
MRLAASQRSDPDAVLLSIIRRFVGRPRCGDFFPRRRWYACDLQRESSD